MKFPVIHADTQGETHFGVQEIQERELAVGPPPNPTGQMSDLGAVTTMSVISFRAGTEAPAHNAPQPYVVIVLSGEGEVMTSDGEARRFRAGELLMCNDLTGKGHVTRAITDLELAFISRAKS
jgi:quercetin dioxygenase-like cupin family protein